MKKADIKVGMHVAYDRAGGRSRWARGDEATVIAVGVTKASRYAYQRSGKVHTFVVDGVEHRVDGSVIGDLNGNGVLIGVTWYGKDDYKYLVVPLNTLVGEWNAWKADQDAIEQARETYQIEKAARRKANYKQAKALAKRLKKVGIDAGYISEYDDNPITLTLDEIETLLGLAENGRA